LAETILVCPQCDMVHRAAPMPAECCQECARCGALLDRGRPAVRADPLALVIGSLVLLVLANLQPVVELAIRGRTASTTLFNAVLVLFGEERPIVASLVAVTTLLAPCLELLAMCYVLLPLRVGVVPPRLSLVMRGIQTVRPWGMIEVFVLGTLVAAIKLAHVARVVPGGGIWSFAALVLLMAGTAATFDASRVWRRAFAIDRLAVLRGYQAVARAGHAAESA
jgi:paraquat-inducible protein A